MKKKAIVFFRGYNRERKIESSKFEIIKKHYLEEHYDRIIFDTSEEGFRERLSDLEKTLANYSHVGVIGSSMGCLASLYMHFKYECKLVLINPSYFTEITLKDSLSPILKNEIIDFKREIELLRNGKGINLFLAEDDERLDHSKFIEHFDENIKLIIKTPTGGHQFTVFEEQFDRISNLLCDWSEVESYDMGEIWMDFDNDFCDDVVIIKK